MMLRCEQVLRMFIDRLQDAEYCHIPAAQGLFGSLAALHDQDKAAVGIEPSPRQTRLPWCRNP
jgi:hypothetical protein